jgi:hypothetical protein
VYEAKFEESAKMGLKLDLRADQDQYPWPGNDTDSRPLFEKYQFFTPGLFPSPLAHSALYFQRTLRWPLPWRPFFNPICDKG